jgi:predicted HD phosphohydrolase
MVAAALLHDVGHVLLPPPDLCDLHRDRRHEEIGADWLQPRFGVEVGAPVRLHVAAKRYLCATEPRYLARLSDASLHSLALQGGPMNAAERAAFEASPWHLEALDLRRLDDAAKVPGAPVPALESYLPLLEELERRASSTRTSAPVRPGLGRTLGA